MSINTREKKLKRCAESFKRKSCIKTPFNICIWSDYCWEIMYTCKQKKSIKFNVILGCIVCLFKMVGDSVLFGNGMVTRVVMLRVE